MQLIRTKNKYLSSLIKNKKDIEFKDNPSACCALQTESEAGLFALELSVGMEKLKKSITLLDLELNSCQ